MATAPNTNPNPIPNPLISGDTYYLNIFLKTTYKNLGQYEILTKNEAIGTLTTITFSQDVLPPIELGLPYTITVTGLTKSRLNEVKTYDLKYKIGVNGVFNITSEFIEYKIQNIKYKTFLNDGLTIFSVDKPTNNFDNELIIGNNDSVFVDLKKTLNAMIIERSNISVYEYFNKLNNCDNIDDMLDYF